MVFSFALHTDDDPDTHLDVYNSSIGGQGYDVLKIGEFSWFPSRKQLIELRDKIDTALGETPVEDRPPNPLVNPPVTVPPIATTREAAEAYDAALEGCSF